MNPSEATIRERKQALREQVQKKLAALDPRLCTEASRRVRDRVLALPEFQKAKSILTFVSMTGEADTHELIRRSLREGKRVCVPTFDRSKREYFVVEIRDFERDLALGHYGILEPRSAEPADKQCDLALVPGLAFDAKGHRLGRGKGYYDKLLKEFRGIKVALTYQVQVVNEVPVASNDIPMDIVVTENATFRRDS